METDRVTMILVVANRTAAAPQLLDEVRRRAEAGRCRFSLLIPDVSARGAADWTLEIALPLLSRAAKSPVEGLVGGAEPLASVKRRWPTARSTRSSSPPSRSASRTGSGAT